jgi:hypothetical protein
MPAAIQNNLAGFIQTVSRLNNVSSTRQIQQATQRIGGTNADTLNLSRLQNLDTNVAQFLNTVRSAQTTLAQTQAEQQTLQGFGSRIQELRNIATQATRTNLTTEERTALSERFNALQNEVNTTAAKTKIQGQNLGERLANPASQTSASGIQITGTGRVDGVRFEEAGAAFETSNVARSAGLVNIQVADEKTNAVFRFQDAGNGQITVTRFNNTENGLQEAGSQTVAINTLQNREIAPGQTETLNFDRLGVAITLNNSFIAGDLNGIQAQVTPPPEPAETPAVSESNAEPPSGLAFDLSNIENAANAVAGLNTSLNNLGSLQARVSQVGTQSQQTIANAFAEISAGNNSTDLTSGFAQQLENDLRNAVLQQASNALQSQGGFNRESLVNLLSI